MVKLVETNVRVLAPPEGHERTVVGSTGHVHETETDCPDCAELLVRQGWTSVARRRRLKVLEATGEVLGAEELPPESPDPLPSAANPVAFLREVLKDPRWQAALREILAETPPAPLKRGKKEAS